MAEILGAVASGLAVAEVGLKVGGTVWRLKKLWQEVHQVPATIQDMMRQVEMMDPILSDHETTLGNQSIALSSQLPTLNTVPAISSAAYCREALIDLRRLVDDLDGAVESEKRSRRTVARMRVVLKRDTIKGFQDRLEKAIRLVQATQVSYLAANATISGAMMTDMWTAVTDIQAQQQLILQQLNNSNSSSSTGKPPFPVITQDAKTSQEQTFDKGRTVQRQGGSVCLPWSRPSIFGAIMFRKSESDAAGEATYAVRIQLPRWLYQSVWDISISRAYSGWQGSLSTWNIVPRDSPGMLCVRNGDLDGLLDLFDRGLASPRDRNVLGTTLFNLACYYSHTHIVKHFINMNLDITNLTAMDISAAPDIFGVPLAMPINIIRQLASRGCFHFLANAAEDFEFYNETLPWDMNLLWSARCLALASNWQELFDLCLRTYFPFWNDLPPILKQTMVMHGIGFGGWAADGLRRLICPDGPIRPIDTKAWNDGDGSILHMVFSSYLVQSFRAEAGDFKTLLEEAIQATDDVHHASESENTWTDVRDYCTALQEGLLMLLNCGLDEGLTEERNACRGLERLTRALQSLMSVLASCDYDLLEFGRQEAVTWVGQCNADSIIGDALYLGFRYNEVCEVKAVHYGAEPRDWYFEVDCHHEEYAGAFWNLIENPHLFMVPGAWVDEE